MLPTPERNQSPPQNHDLQQSPNSLRQGRERSRSRSLEQGRPYNRFNQRRRENRVRPSLAGGLLTFKQFMELQHFPMSTFDAQKFYEEYKTEYEKKHLEIFFSEHKDEHWFIEKYDPIVSQKWQEERNSNAKVASRGFIEQVRNQKFSELCLLEGQEPENISGPPYFGFDPNSLTLFLKTIPVNISRWDLLNVVKISPGFKSLSMSEPLKSQGFSRFAWVLYDNDQHCQESLSFLNNKQVTQDFRLSPIRSQSSSKREMKIYPSQPIVNLHLDWRQTARLITCLDSEKGVNENPLLISEEIFNMKSQQEQEFQLDLQILYLRKVHAFCYYCLEEYDDERLLAAKCGPCHLRGHWDPSTERSTAFDEQIEKRFNRVWNVEQYDRENDYVLQQMLIDFEKREMVQEQDYKVRCKLCRKLFRGVEFIRKHFHNKHEDEIASVYKQRYEQIKLENYLKDDDKLMNPITYAGESYRSFDRRRNTRPRATQDNTVYEDLDEPNRSRSRKLIDYGDI